MVNKLIGIGIKYDIKINIDKSQVSEGIQERIIAD
jgi:hypothetical protein